MKSYLFIYSMLVAFVLQPIANSPNQVLFWIAVNWDMNCPKCGASQQFQLQWAAPLGQNQCCNLLFWTGVDWDANCRQSSYQQLPDNGYCRLDETNTVIYVL